MFSIASQPGMGAVKGAVPARSGAGLRTLRS